MPKTRPPEESQAIPGLGLVPPYPDLPIGPGRPGQVRDGAQVRHAGGPDGAGHTASGRLGPLLLTFTGRNRQQLDYRLRYITGDFLAHAVSRPGRRARLDPFGPQASWVIEALVAASLARVKDEDEGRKDSLAELTDAVRLAEDRWLTVRRDLHRGTIVQADLRPTPPGGGPSIGRTADRQPRVYHERVPGRGAPVDSGMPVERTYGVAAQHGLIAPQRGGGTSYQQHGRKEPSRKV